MKHDFYEIRSELDKRPEMILPMDINEPIRKAYSEFPLILKWIDRIEKGKLTARIEYVSADRPSLRILLKSECGMITGYDRWTEHRDEKGSMCEFVYIKNHNLQRKKDAVRHDDRNG